MTDELSIPDLAKANEHFARAMQELDALESDAFVSLDLLDDVPPCRCPCGLEAAVYDSDRRLALCRECYREVAL